MTGLLAGRFTCRANKPANAQTSLANIINAPVSKLEWGQNASINSNKSAGWFIRRNCEQIGQLSNLLANAASKLAHSDLFANVASRLAYSDLLTKAVGGSVYSNLLAHFQVNFCHVILQIYPAFSIFIYPDSSISCLRNTSAKNESYILSYAVLFLLLLLLIAIPIFYYRKDYLYILGVSLSGVGRYLLWITLFCPFAASVIIFDKR